MAGHTRLFYFKSSKFIDKNRARLENLIVFVDAMIKCAIQYHALHNRLLKFTKIDSKDQHERYPKF